MNIPCIAFLERICFHFLSFSQKTGISERCDKDVKLASRKRNPFIAFSRFMAPKNAKIFQVLQAEQLLASQ
jgi:hypothetical protein